MSKIILMKQPQGLIYINDPGKKIIDKLEIGQRVLVTIHTSDPRSINQHRWFMGFLRLIYDNTEHNYQNFDHYLLAIKSALGWMKDVDIKGKTITVPQSLAFDAMKQDEFQKHIEQFKDWVQANLMPVSDDELKQMVAAYMEQEGM